MNAKSTAQCLSVQNLSVIPQKLTPPSTLILVLGCVLTNKQCPTHRHMATLGYFSPYNK